MGGLGIDARDKLEVAANATVTVGDGKKVIPDLFDIAEKYD